MPLNGSFYLIPMHEIQINPAADKAETYRSLLPQLEALISGETDPVANLANLASALHHAFGFFWTGFYLVKGSELVLGPFQGTPACTRIAFGKGVCGAAWQQNKTIVVPDVNAFPGHIACSHASRSEIVVPGSLNGTIRLVLDIDSEQLAFFNETDARMLEQVMDLANNFILPLLPEQA